MVRLKAFRSRSPSFADLTPYAALVDDGVVLLKDGSLMAGWYFAGSDLESAIPAERNALSRRINAILSRLGTGWMLQVEAARVPASRYPEAEKCAFPDRISRLIDEERRQNFESGQAHFETRHAIFLTFRSAEPRQSKLLRYTYSQDSKGAYCHAEAVLEAFCRRIAELENDLSNVLQLRRMKSVKAGQSGQAIYCEIFQFIRYAISGEIQPVRLPAVPMYLDWLATAEFTHGLAPITDNKHVALVAIDGLPAESWPGMLDGLDRLGFSYRWSSRFIYLDPEEARDRLERTRRKWQQKVRPFMDQLLQTQSRSIDQDAMTMVTETEDAIAQAASGLVSYGYYTPVIVIFDEMREQLMEKAESVRVTVQAEGFGARIETLNATEAYLGSLPGNWFANIREPLIHTRNLADLLPLNSLWSGRPEAPCPFYAPRSPCLMQVSSGSTPFSFNLHVHDVGHTLIFGPTGSGKSTLLALIAAQFRRYEDAQIFVFDKGHSMFALTSALGGQYYDFLSDHLTNDPPITLCPLACLETDADRAFACEWIEMLIALQGVEVAPDLRNAVSRQIALMAGADERSLSDFVSGVQMRVIKDALHPYTIDGAMGQLLDGETDSIALGNFQCFEIGELMQIGERSLVPLLAYLFRRIEKALDGAPSLIILDEAWLMLGHRVFREKIREWLKVLRKANCAVVLATQSISDVERSGIIDVLKESCPTKICLANPTAREPGSRGFYEALGFTERQLEIVASARPRRDYYAVSSEGRRLFDMEMGAIALAFTAVSDPASLSRVRTLITEHGSAWPKFWLMERGVEIDV